MDFNQTSIIGHRLQAKPLQRKRALARKSWFDLDNDGLDIDYLGESPRSGAALAQRNAPQHHRREIDSAPVSFGLLQSVERVGYESPELEECKLQRAAQRYSEFAGPSG